MFEAALNDLVRETDAELAVFCDYEGEAIALATKSMDPYDVKVSGAQVGALLFSLQEMARESGQSERVSVTCTTDRHVMLMETLPGGYYLVLAVKPETLWPRARHQLKAIADRFLTEL